MSEVPLDSILNPDRSRGNVIASPHTYFNLQPFHLKDFRYKFGISNPTSVKWFQRQAKSEM